MERGSLHLPSEPVRTAALPKVGPMPVAVFREAYRKEIHLLEQLSKTQAPKQRKPPKEPFAEYSKKPTQTDMTWLSHITTNSRNVNVWKNSLASKAIYDLYRQVDAARLPQLLTKSLKIEFKTSTEMMQKLRQNLEYLGLGRLELTYVDSIKLAMDFHSIGSTKY